MVRFLCPPALRNAGACFINIRLSVLGVLRHKKTLAIYIYTTSA